MNIDATAMKPLVASLRGKTTTFLLETRETNLELTRALLSSTDGRACLLDLDSLYSSNADLLFGQLPEERQAEIQVRVPTPDSNINQEISSIFETDLDLLMVDNLNSLNHLLSVTGRGTRARRLSFILFGLSFRARQSDCIMAFTAYHRRMPPKSSRASSLAELTDLTVSAKKTHGGLNLGFTREEI